MIQQESARKLISSVEAGQFYREIKAGKRPVPARMSRIENRYRYDPVAYIQEKLGWTPWAGSDGVPGQKEILDAYTLALRQQHEREAFQNGTITESELKYWKLDEVIKNRIRVESGHTVGKCVIISDMITLSDGTHVPAGELVGKSFSLLTLVNGLPSVVDARAEFNGVEPVYELVTDTGKRIARNAHHPLFVADAEFCGGKRPNITSRGFVATSELRPGQLIAVAESLPAFGTLDVPDYEIKLLAYLIGDGGYTSTHVTFTQQEGLVLDEFRECAKYYDCTLNHRGNYDYQITGVSGRTGGKPLNHVMNLLRRHEMMGLHSRDKRIPKFVHNLPERKLALFLSRLFATDGWASLSKDNHREIGFCSASQGLIADIAFLLQKLGIHARIGEKSKVNASTLSICYASDVIRFAEKVGIFSKEEALDQVVASARETHNTKLRNITARPDRPRWCYKNAPQGTRWEKIESIVMLPDPQPTVAIEVPGHHTYLTQFYEHNTCLASGIVNHFFDNFTPCVGYCFAPSWEQIHDLLFKEIKTHRRDKGLPGRILDLELQVAADHFIKGKATNNADSSGTERAQGQHGKYNLFVLDEAEGIPEFVWNAVDGMTSGGISIVLMTANPRTRSSRFHKSRTQSNVQSFRISCLQHPNVIANKEIVPNAVKRQYVNEMIEKHCRVVDKHNPDDHTFEVPWLPEKIFEPDAEMMYRVLGLAPANISDKNLVPYGRYEAATKRQPQEDRPTEARLGLDCARWGRDLGKGYTRWNGRAYCFGSFARQDSFEYYFTTKKECLKLKELGVTSLHIRVDAGGGFGSGVVDLLKVDDELISGFSDFKVIECSFGGSPRDSHAYYDSITEWTADVAESLKSLAVQNPPDTLEQDLCEREVEPRNKEGRFVRKLEEKDKFRKRIGRSPDDGDGFVLAVALDHVISEVGWSEFY